MFDDYIRTDDAIDVNESGCDSQRVCARTTLATMMMSMITVFEALMGIFVGVDDDDVAESLLMKFEMNIPDIRGCNCELEFQEVSVSATER